MSFALNAGDRLGIVGPSGAGKTVLLRSLTLLDPLDAGEVRLRGRSVRGDAAPVYRSLAIYLHQRPALFEGTVEENLRYPFSLTVHRMGPFDRGRAVELLTMLGRDAAFLDKSSPRTLRRRGPDRRTRPGRSARPRRAPARRADSLARSGDGPGRRGGWSTAGSSRGDRERALVWVSHDREQALRLTGRSNFASCRPSRPGAMTWASPISSSRTSRSAWRRF